MTPVSAYTNSTGWVIFIAANREFTCDSTVSFTIYDPSQTYDQVNFVPSSKTLTGASFQTQITLTPLSLITVTVSDDTTGISVLVQKVMVTLTFGAYTTNDYTGSTGQCSFKSSTAFPFGIGTTLLVTSTDLSGVLRAGSATLLV